MECPPGKLLAEIVMNVNDKPDQKIESYPYKGKPIPVKDVWIR